MPLMLKSSRQLLPGDQAFVYEIVSEHTRSIGRLNRVSVSRTRFSYSNRD
jgi:hypothetical protein